MFKRYQISTYRAMFWFISLILYWVLIFFSWWNTRFRVFLGYEMFMDLLDRKKLPDIFSNLDELSERAWLAIADSGATPGIFLTIPLVMAIVMFAAPFFVRRDYRAPLRGVVMLPLTAILCYIFTGLINMVVAACMGLGIHHYLDTSPGPDFLMFLVHPLYLLYPPALKSIPGFAAQIVYVVFICSVLTTKGKKRFRAIPEEGDEAVQYETYAEPAMYDEEKEEDENITSCVMETDRLCRIIDSKVSQPSLVHRIRSGIMDYINTPHQVESDVNMGMPHYRIVLVEAAKQLREMIDEDPKRPGAREAFEFVINDMEKMEYCTQQDCAALRYWLKVKTSDS